MLMVMLTLTGCAKGISNEDTKRLILPTYFQYSQERQNMVADELESGKCNASSGFIKDYGIVRKQIREVLK